MYHNLFIFLQLEGDFDQTYQNKNKLLGNWSLVAPKIIKVAETKSDKTIKITLDKYDIKTLKESMTYIKISCERY